MRKLSPIAVLFLLFAAASLEGCRTEDMEMEEEDYELAVTSTEAMETDMAVESTSSDTPELLEHPAILEAGAGGSGDPREVTKTHRTRGYKPPSETGDASSRPPAPAQ